MLLVPSAPRTLLALLYAAVVLLLPASAAHAQEASDSRLALQESAPPAHIAAVDGPATVERDGESQPAIMSAPFVPGDRLRTTDGRVEVLFPDGTALDVDQHSAVDLQDSTLIRVGSGRILLVVSGAGDPAAATRYQIDTPAASARTNGPGEYRISVLTQRGSVETELAVLRGSASLETDQGSMPIGAGERTVAREGEAPSYAQAVNSARYDAFDLWAASQRDARTGAAQSAQYLPQDLRMYGGTLDRYGSWEYTQPYGYVWYPAVAVDWQPYYHGYWAPYRQWGWTWVGVDFWSWPTHHYGRWGFLRSRWFWIPGRSWGPAWVSWASAPGYVSWCPLGFDGRPVFAFSLGFTSRWGGWTILPRHSFGQFARADRFAVSPRTIPATTAFVSHRSAPIEVPRVAHASAASGASRGVAVLRQSTVASRQSPVGSRQSPVGVRSPGYAVPRSSGLPSPAIADDRVRPSPAAPPRNYPVPQAVPRAPAPDSRRPANDYRATPAVPRAPASEYRPPAADHRVAPPVYSAPQAQPRVYSPPPAPPRVYEAPSAQPRVYSAPPPPPRTDSPPPPPRSYSVPPSAPRSAPGPAAVPRSGESQRSAGSPQAAGASHSSGESHGSGRRR